ncbi:hypothetical protein [Rhizobium sp. 2MFCol3.1]|uniref:hypothetical protein n=1 Tax=Rhizobium sp. 2MFCol3.1 TaxID=1246459 RepID=UPI000372DB85|nr:hypothetical protein [Rhizobium sp. 2MFCol3.1]
MIKSEKTPPSLPNLVPAGTVVGLIDWNGTIASVIDAVLEARSAVYTLPAEFSVGGTLEADPLTLQGYCQQLLDIIQNYEVDIEGEDNDLIAHISRAVDPARAATSEGQP